MFTHGGFVTRLVTPHGTRASSIHHGSTLSPEACFRAAVDLSRKQGSKGFELRSSIALAREYHERGLDTEAVDLVRKIRAQFTEGLDTRDIRDADDFLRSLSK